MRDKQTRKLVDEYRVLMNEKINAWLSLPSKEYQKVRERVNPRMAELADQIDDRLNKLKEDNLPF